MPSFQRALDLDADAVELDVRLTADHVPVVYHYFYLEEVTGISGPIFNYTFHQLQNLSVFGNNSCRISSLPEVLDTVGGKIGVEIEIKGPEPESTAIVSDILHQFKPLWETIEVTSYEPMLLADIQQRCPGLATDLLFPRPEAWMKQDVVTHSALHLARLARARAVHLHPTQLASETVSTIRQQGIEVHAWDVNDEEALNRITELDIPRICTDKLQSALDFRQRVETKKD
jgi:glycerophosphoryl diester phosphodiesterase